MSLNLNNNKGSAMKSKRKISFESPVINFTKSNSLD